MSSPVATVAEQVQVQLNGRDRPEPDIEVGVSLQGDNLKGFPRSDASSETSFGTLHEENEQLKLELESLQQKYENLKVVHEDLQAENTGLKADMGDDPQVEMNSPECALDYESGWDVESSKSAVVMQRGGSFLMNKNTAEQSALAMSRPAQVVIYTLGLALPIFVLVAPSMLDQEDNAHRRLGGGGGHELIMHIAYSMVGAGIMAFAMHLLKQPLLLGYILGGMLVGPIGLSLVNDSAEVQRISELGLIILLFMIGLELNVAELLKMGKVVLLTGLLQFPICAGTMCAIFMMLQSAGMSFGSGPFSTLYPGLCCGISSTMIVVKLLSEKMETDTAAGRLTVGVLIFQDIWAIVMLAIQPNLDNPEILGILKTFGMIAALILVATMYAKYVMPAVLSKSSTVLELMMVLSLTWCFFVCCIALLPFANLSMELAALIAGVSMATFPYSAEFNGKLKYIRDFFITLYFVALGMQIPVPTIGIIAKALVVAVVVLVVRWLGLFCVIFSLGGGQRLGALATINLSEVSEFSLVICALGRSFGHVDDETMTILIWTFSVLAVSAAYLIGYNHKIADRLSPCLSRFGCGIKSEGGSEEDHHDMRDIVILGFGKVVSALITEFEHRCPQILSRIHIIDVNESLSKKLSKKGIKFDYGDVTSRDVLEHAHHGSCKLVLSTIPDSNLKVGSNMQILAAARDLWPQAQIIVTAERRQQSKELYSAGASYVLKITKLGAERLADLIWEGETATCGAGRLKELMLQEQEREDQVLKRAKTELWV